MRLELGREAVDDRIDRSSASWRSAGIRSA